eukprot:gene4676-5286_t
MFQFVVLLSIILVCGLGHGLDVPSLYSTAPRPNSFMRYETEKSHMICGFNSSLPINVSWSKDGKILTYGTRIYSKLFAVNVGQINSIYYTYLYVDALTMSDAGIYNCTASNAHGIGGTGSFSLHVKPQYKPVMLIGYPPSKLVLYKGQAHQMLCRADARPTVESYIWTKKSGFIDTHRVKLKNNALYFTYASEDQAGEYLCQAKNTIGTSLKSVQVSIVGNPAWGKKISNLTLEAGDLLSLTGFFYGSTVDLKITWYLNNAILLTKTIPDNGKTSGMLKAAYSVKSANVQHNGKYILEIRNSYGRISCGAYVLVYSKPQVVITEGVQLTATEGDSTQITCTAQGYPLPSITWSTDGHLLAKTSLGSSPSGHGVKASLTQLIRATKGVKMYVCTAENQIGRDQALITITTHGKKSTIVKNDAGKQKQQENNSKVPIIIGIISGIVIIIVIVLSVYLIFYRKRKRDDEERPIGSVKYGRHGNEYSEQLDDSAELISQEQHRFMESDSAPTILPRHSKRRRSSDNRPTKRASYKTASRDRVHNKVNFLERQYAVILPLGQGRLLAYEDLNLGEVCGSGQFGIVVKGTINEDGNTTKQVAVKMLKDNAGLSERKMMLDELNIMKSLSHHPNVISLVGWVITEDNVYIVEELVTCGSLLHYLRSKRVTLQSHYVNVAQSPLTDKDVLTFAWQIAAGMKYLSSQNVVHRDLAARNVLMAHENICKISDFGLARQIYENTNYKKTSAGELPVRWMASESLFKGIYNSTSDVWSFGILLWEITNLGDIPYPNISKLDALVAYLRDENRMQKPPHCSDALYEIMLSCWEEEPAKRPDFVDLKNRLGKMLFDNSTHIDFTGLETYLEKLQEEDEDEIENEENNIAVDIDRVSPDEEVV